MYFHIKKYAFTVLLAVDKLLSLRDCMHTSFTLGPTQFQTC